MMGVVKKWRGDGAGSRPGLIILCYGGSIPPPASKFVMKTHKENQKRHLRIRAWERLGTFFTEQQCDEIAERIKRGEGEYLGKISLRLAVVRLEVFKGKRAIFLYDEKTETPATVLTEELWQSKKVANSPKIKDTAPLRSALGENKQLVEELSKLQIKEKE